MRIEEIDPTTAPDADLACWYEALREQHEELDADEPFVPQQRWTHEVRAAGPGAPSVARRLTMGFEVIRSTSTWHASTEAAAGALTRGHFRVRDRFSRSAGPSS